MHMRDCGGWVAIQRHPQQGRSQPCAGSRRLSALGQKKTPPVSTRGKHAPGERQARGEESFRDFLGGDEALKVFGQAKSAGIRGPIRVRPASGDPRTSRTVRADCITNQSTGKCRSAGSCRSLTGADSRGFVIARMSSAIHCIQGTIPAFNATCNRGRRNAGLTRDLAQCTVAHSLSTSSCLNSSMKVNRMRRRPCNQAGFCAMPQNRYANIALLTGSELSRVHSAFKRQKRTKSPISTKCKTACPESAAQISIAGRRKGR